MDTYDVTDTVNEVVKAVARNPFGRPVVAVAVLPLYSTITVVKLARWAIKGD